MDQFKGKIIDKQFVPDNPLMYDQHLKKMEGKEIVRTDKKFSERKDKSLAQLGYYFGYVLPDCLCPYFGYDKKAMHEALKYQILVVNRGIYQKLPYAPSIEDFSTAEFEQFMREVRQWASAEYGIFINLPNEIGYDFEL